LFFTFSAPNGSIPAFFDPLSLVEPLAVKELKGGGEGIPFREPSFVGA